MKLQEKIADVKSGNIDSSLQYQVATNAKMMRMLSDQLYSDKILAPVRELSTNAWDSHIESGNTDKVPKVTLPSEENPYFVIRDFGSGMSKDSMEKIYRRYGISTKTNSNDYNGQMGIGSKSPFAYTDSFTATSYHNGIRYIYINAKGEDGIPALHFVGEEPTTEPNGLEISFKVNERDFGRFERAAQKVYPWFPQHFDVFLNQAKLTFDRPSVLEEIGGDDWKVRDSREGVSWALMGNVIYPIDKSQFQKKNLTEETEIKNDWYQHYGDTNYLKLLDIGLEIHFEIGEVEMDISREGLSYTPATIKAIRGRLDEIWAYFSKKSNELFDHCKDMLEARKTLYKIRSGDNSRLSGILLTTTPRFNDETVKTTVNATIDNSKPFVNVYYGNKKGQYSWRSGSKRMRRRNHVSEIKVTDATEFVLNDVKTGGYAAAERLAESMMTNGISNPDIYLIRFDGTDADLKSEIEGIIGTSVDNLRKVSDLPKPQRKKRDSTGRVLEKTFVLSQTKHWKDKKNWTPSELAFSEGGLYVEINSYKVVDEIGRKMDASDFQDHISRLEKLGIKVPENIYGIKTAIVSKYKDSKKWTSFEDWAKAKLEKLAQKKRVQKLVNDQDFCEIEALSYLSLLIRTNTPDVPKDIAEISKLYKEKKKFLNSNEGLKKRIDKFPSSWYTIPEAEKGDADIESAKKIFEKYGMLNHSLSNVYYDRNSGGKSLQQLIDYLNLVNSQGN